MMHLYGLIVIEVCIGICLQENGRDTRIKYADQMKEDKIYQFNEENTNAG